MVYLKYRTLQENSVKQDMLELLKKHKTDKTKYLNPKINRQNLAGKLLTFSDNESIFEKIANEKVYLNDKEVAQGIVFPQDFLDNKNAKKLGNNYKVGDCVFGLTNEKVKELDLTKEEKKLIKPYYTSEQIYPYYVNKKNDKWLIYTDSKFKKSEYIKPFPNLKKHIDQFKDIFTSDKNLMDFIEQEKNIFLKVKKLYH